MCYAFLVTLIFEDGAEKRHGGEYLTRMRALSVAQDRVDNDARVVDYRVERRMVRG